MLLDKQDSLNLKNGVYEPVETILIKHLLKSTDICLDIGAHIGYFTLLMAKHGLWVHAFEPYIPNHNILMENLKKYGVWNADAFLQAVTDQDYTQTELYICDSNSGMHRLYKSKWWNGNVNLVPTNTLDYLFLKIQKIGFIKMDIEGSEFGALKGGKKLLEKDHPIMIMEFHPPSIEEYGADPKEEYDFLKALGYSIRLIPKISIPISFEELDKETRRESSRNILCLPPDHSL